MHKCTTKHNPLKTKFWTSWPRQEKIDRPQVSHNYQLSQTHQPALIRTWITNLVPNLQINHCVNHQSHLIKSWPQIKRSAVVTKVYLKEMDQLIGLLVSCNANKNKNRKWVDPSSLPCSDILSQITQSRPGFWVTRLTLQAKEVTSSNIAKPTHCLTSLYRCPTSVLLRLHLVQS